MAETFEAQGREPAFDAVIPAPVRYCDELCANAKLLYGEIRALCGPYGYCWATNAYFAELYSVNERSIARWISQIEKLKFIAIKVTRNALGHVDGRRIYVGCGFPEAENVTLSHMTKKSAYMTKMSGLNDKNVSQDGRHIKINNNNKKGDACAPAREKKAVDADAREYLRSWAKRQYPEQSEDLIADLMDFCDIRVVKKVPMVKVSIAERCVKRLMQFSEGRIEVIRAILDRSIRKPWADVYKLPDDELAEALGRSSNNAGGEDGLKWV